MLLQHLLQRILLQVHLPLVLQQPLLLIQILLFQLLLPLVQVVGHRIQLRLRSEHRGNGSMLQRQFDLSL